MPTTYYVDPAATGANNGTSWNDAWTSLASAVSTGTAVSSLDTVYCRGVQALTTAILVNGLTIVTGQYVKIIGCNAAGVVDGTRFKLDGNSAATNCLSIRKNYLWLENIETTKATGSGFIGEAASSYGRAVNCISHTNGDMGFQGNTSLNYWSFSYCRAYNNVGKGFSDCCYGDSSSGLMSFCVAYNNGTAGAPTGHGFQDTYGGRYYNCLSFGNYGAGFRVESGVAIHIDGCVAYGNLGANGHGIYVVWASVFFCVITNTRGCGNAQYGLTGRVNVIYYTGGNNRFVNNTAGQTNLATQLTPRIGYPADVITGTDDNMINSASGNFMTKTPIGSKFTALAMDAINSAYLIEGLPANPDFPAVANVRTNDTVDGATGTWEGLYSAAEEAARNTLTSGGAADVLAGRTWKNLNNNYTGTLQAVTSPTAPTIKTVKNITATSAIVVFEILATTDSLKVYKDGTLVEAGVTDLEYSLTGLAPNTSYSITAKSTNLAGDSAASTAYVFATTGSDSDANATLLSSATVAVVTVSGNPKIVGHGTAKVFDVRCHPNALSLKAIDYYWKDVISNKGRSTLPEMK